MLTSEIRMEGLELEGFGYSSGPAGNLWGLFSLLSYRPSWPVQKRLIYTPVTVPLYCIAVSDCFKECLHMVVFVMYRRFISSQRKYVQCLWLAVLSVSSTRK